MKTSAETPERFSLQLRLHQRNKVAEVQVNHRFRCPMFRVWVKGKENDEVYILYLVNMNDKKFFWYPLDEEKERIAAAIAKALENNINILL